MCFRAYSIRLSAAFLGFVVATNCAFAVDIYTCDEAKQQIEQKRATEQSANKLPGWRLFKKGKSAPAQDPAANAPTSKDANGAKQPPAPQGVQTPVAETIHGSLSAAVPPVVAAGAKSLPAKKSAAQKSKPDAARISQPAPERRGKAPCVTWINNDAPVKAVLLCVHGLGLHNESYKTFGQSMAADGVATYAVDVRGFGSWMKSPENQRVDFPWCLQDIHDTLKVLHRVHPNVPVFILGESMGGAIALRATAMYPDLIDGLISCVPSGDRFKQGRTDLKIAWRILHGINTPFDIGTSVVAQASSSHAPDNKKAGTDKNLEQHWLDDMLNRKELSPKELMQFQRFMNENHEFAKQIKDKPVLMIQGGDDALVKASGTLQLLLNIPLSNPADVDLVVIRKAKHLIFEESECNDQAFNARVVRLVNNWIDDHSKRQDSTLTQAP